MSSDFRTSYATLARIAARLEEGDADIDEVLPLLEEAKAAYASCQERLEAVRQALGDVDAGSSDDLVDGLADEDESEED